MKERALVETISFFAKPRPIQLSEVAEQCGCQLIDEHFASLTILTVGPVEAAPEGSLTFLSNAKYIPALEQTRAAAVICSPKHAERTGDNIARLVSDNPYRSFALLMGIMFPSGMRPMPITDLQGVSSAAHIEPSAKLEEGVVVEPGAVIGQNAEIGAEDR